MYLHENWILYCKQDVLLCVNTVKFRPSLLQKLRSPTDKVKSELVNSGTPCSRYEGWLYCQHHAHYMPHSNLI